MSADPTRQQLQRAYELIRAGKKAEAEAILLPILKADEDNANAWWLLANALNTPTEIREALENVLRLRPGDAKAQKMLDDLNARFPTDEFPMDSDLGSSQTADWAADLSEKPKRGGPPVRVQKSGGGTNPLVIILAVVGVLALIGCAVCFVLPTIGISIFGQQILNEVMTAAPELQEMFETITAMPGIGGQISGNTTQRGSIEYGQTVTGTIRGVDDESWTFNGNSGDRVTIELNAADDNLDPEIFLLDPSNRQIAYDDDSGGDTNSEIVITLPGTGTYTIRASAFFGQGGAYELTLRRG
jgi:hypothetical protein